MTKGKNKTRSPIPFISTCWVNKNRFWKHQLCLGTFHLSISRALSSVMAGKWRVRPHRNCCQTIFILTSIWVLLLVMLRISGHIHAWNLLLKLRENVMLSDEKS
jgi:hypothetical protein